MDNILLEYSRALKNVPEKYHDFIKDLHRSGLLLHDQPLEPSQSSEPAWTDIRADKKTKRWQSSKPASAFIVWGDKNAALVKVGGDEYTIYTKGDLGKLEKNTTTNASELKRNIKQIVGKVQGHSIFQSSEIYAGKPLQLTNPEVTDIRDIQKLKHARKKRLEPAQTKIASTDVPQLVQTVLNKAQLANKLTPEYKNLIYQEFDNSKINTPFLIYEMVKPLLFRYINRTLGDINQLMKAKVDAASKHFPSEKNQKQIQALYTRARALAVFARAMKENEIQDLYTGGRIDPVVSNIFNSIGNAIKMAAAEKYDEETTISGYPIRNERTQYRGTDGSEASGEGYQRFLHDLNSGDKLALGSVMKWLGVLL